MLLVDGIGLQALIGWDCNKGQGAMELMSISKRGHCRRSGTRLGQVREWLSLAMGDTSDGFAAWALLLNER